MLPLRFLQAQNAEELANPLAHYPNRGWEKLYRNQYAYDSAFSWVCAPNDTHNCRITAHVRNGVIVRLGEEFDVATYSDLYGNKATANWGNRHCAKGYTFHRILYGPYRLKHPIVRRGWKRWADDGFPELTKEAKAKYKFDSRGTDKFERISWERGLRLYRARHQGHRHPLQRRGRREAARSPGLPAGDDRRHGRARARARSRCAAAWACWACSANTACTACAIRSRCWTHKSAA